MNAPAIADEEFIEAFLLVHKGTGQRPEPIQYGPLLLRLDPIQKRLRKEGQL